MTTVPRSRADAEELDRADPLRQHRDAFDLPRDLVYLDGNSLGPPPRAVQEAVRVMVEVEWGRGLISSWNEAGWMEASARIGDKIGRLVGARPGEVVVADSTSINVFKLLAAALSLRPGRRVILQREGDFPTDGYVTEGLAELVGAGRRVVPAGALAAALDADTAVLCVTHVDYRTGEMLDMPRLTRAAHDAGALILWDLAHSAGAVPIDLAGCGVDLAVGCGYKYLNGGPGAPAYAMAATRHHAALKQPLSGWFGHAAPFAFEGAYRAAPGVARLLCGTPPMLSMAALEAGVDLWLTVDMAAVRTKSVALCEMLIGLVDARCGALGVTLSSPRDAAVRGSQVALRHRDAYAVCRALAARGVVGDFRAPDLLRLGLAPLYVRHVDVWDAVDALREVLSTEAWRRPEYARRAAVT